MENVKATITLHNGVKMPKFGLGVFKVEEGRQVEEAVKEALKAGYRLIDTASYYENETGVGKAIKDSGIPREEIFITTKVWNDEQGYEDTLAAFERSLQRLALEYIDLYLIHWPVTGKYLESWKALEKLYKDGRVRAIGVSNFNIHHLQNLMDNSSEKPVINQVELHPRLTQTELRAFCKEHNIKVEAWAPIAKGKLMEEPVIVELAKKYRKTPAQIILRWHLQNDVIIIPKSVNSERIKENADIFDFELIEEDMNKISALNVNERYGADPDTF